MDCAESGAQKLSSFWRLANLSKHRVRGTVGQAQSDHLLAARDKHCVVPFVKSNGVQVCKIDPVQRSDRDRINFGDRRKG
jgi:hypothetical protein